MCNVCHNQNFIVGADGLLKRCPACATISAPAHPERERSEQAKGARLSASRASRYNRAEAERQKAAFLAWLNTNRHVYLAFEASALQLYAAKENRIGAKRIIENMRGHIAAQGGAYGLDNTITSWLVREAIRRHPELASVIETRASLADVLLA
ncbi:MAG TPA: hypothetical protein PKY60_15000 [Thermoflexales bacterium]|nr:hypothetical protein [Thermoflexales bacterium]